MIQITFTKTGVLGIGKRELSVIGRAAIHSPALLWVKKYLRLHFMKVAYPLYGYARRTARYNKRKLARKEISGARAIGEDNPLVFTGHSRESATKNNHIDAKALNYATYRADIIMPTPVLNRQPWMRRELEKVIPSEERMMDREFGKAFEKELNRVGRTTKKTTRHKAAA